jgi:hypothetical protein
MVIVEKQNQQQENRAERRTGGDMIEPREISISVRTSEE